MEDANPTPGAESLTVDDAAARISGILNPHKKEAAPEEVETPEPVATDEPEETSEGTEAAPESPEEATPEKQELAFENLHQLAEALEVPLDDILGKVKARVKIAGEERDVTLAELRDGYQMESDYRRKTSELSEQRKAFEAERDRQAQELNQRMQEAGHMANLLESQLLAEYNSVNWNELRNQNPAEFAALKQEYNDRYAQIQQVKGQVAQTLQQQQQQVEQKSQAELQALLQGEKARLVEKLPEMGDPTKAKQITEGIKGFLKEYGFNDQEISQVYDHRHVLILRDAMKYRELQSKKPSVTTKVREAPNLLKPGAKPPADPKAGVRDKLARLKKTGHVNDAAAALRLLMK